MAACDAVVSLRSPTMGETSGTAIRALSLGKPLVVSANGWFAELPRDVALQVPVDDDEVETLAAALELLAARARRASGDGRKRCRRSPGGSTISAASPSSTRRPASRPRAEALRRRRGAARGERGGSRRGDRARQRRRRPSSRGGWPRSSLGRRLAARPRLGVARAADSRLVRRPREPGARDGRAVHHGRRARLLRARQEPRRRRPVPRPRRRVGRLQPRLSAADQPGLRASSTS